MYNRIMVPLDGSALAECVLPHVDTIARGCGVTEVVLVTVVEPSFVPGGAYSDSGATVSAPEMEKIRELEAQSVRSEGKQYLDRVVGRNSFPGANLRQEVLEGRPAETIVDYAQQNGVDLIAIATHGRSGISRWARGSVADRVLRATCVPILMVRAPGCFSGV
jgi:nucleotide-binding universal stress UspA family protein